MANKRVKIKIEVLKNVIKDLENKAKEHYEDGSQTGIYTAEACQCILDIYMSNYFDSKLEGINYEEHRAIPPYLKGFDHEKRH